MILLFMGVIFTIFMNSYSQLITYFLVQTLASFLILISLILNMDDIFTIALFLKLSIFPFISWYINVLYRFPNFPFFLAGTLHKLPVILILYQFNLHLSHTFFWLCILLTTLCSGLIMLRVVDLRLMLILSSIGNNSWFLVASISGFYIFLLFLFIYSLNLFLILFMLGYFTKLQVVGFGLHSYSNYNPVILLTSISGLPPFPLFFIKIIVIYSLRLRGLFSNLFVVFLLCSSFMIMGYVQSTLKFLVYFYSHSLNLFLKY